VGHVRLLLLWWYGPSGSTSLADVVKTAGTHEARANVLIEGLPILE